MLNKAGPLEKFTLFIAVLVVLTSIVVFATRAPETAENGNYPGLGGDFSLTGINGPVSLQDHRDNVVVMMFGFTYCPDICPTGLGSMSAALNMLEEKELEQVRPMFVSVDPDRDTPQRLDEYTRYFHPRILGITGKKETIDKVVSDYGAFYQMVPLPDSELKYSVDHSARVYVIDKQGRLSKLLYHNSPPAELADSIRALL